MISGGLSFLPVATITAVLGSAPSVLTFWVSVCVRREAPPLRPLSSRFQVSSSPPLRLVFLRRRDEDFPPPPSLLSPPQAPTCCLATTACGVLSSPNPTSRPSSSPRTCTPARWRGSRCPASRPPWGGSRRCWTATTRMPSPTTAAPPPSPPPEDPSRSRPCCRATAETPPTCFW